MGLKFGVIAHYLSLCVKGNALKSNPMAAYQPYFHLEQFWERAYISSNSTVVSAGLIFTLRNACALHPCGSAMNLHQMIRDLRERQKQLEFVIAELEALERIRSGQPGYAVPALRRRGRKFMNAQERRDVSERMKQYWSARKAQESTGKKSRGGLGLANVSSSAGWLPDN